MFRKIPFSFLALLFSLSCGQPQSRSHMDAGSSESFVKVEGGRFTLDGRSFSFMGSNYYRLALSDAFGGNVQKFYKDGRAQYPQVDAVMQGYAEDGVRVIRMWGFACEGSRGSSANPALLKQNFTFDEGGMAQLDYTLAAAGRAGLKVILPLVNFEHEYCGMEWWVENTFDQASAEDRKRLTYSCMNVAAHKVYKVVRNPAECQGIGEAVVTKELFYTDPLVKQKFQDHVKQVLNRKNPYTGRAYRDDPTIMAIEVANEPHTSDYYECMASDVGRKTHADCSAEPISQYRSTYKPGTLVNDWLKHISQYVKSIDTKHLVTSGEEGYRTSHPEAECAQKHSWIHNGSKGVDFALNTTIPTLDFMTTHLYPDNWAVPAYDLPWFDRCIIQDRARLVAAQKKPIIMEETGFNEQAYVGKPDDYRSDRAHFISRMFALTSRAGYQGVMIWQASPLTLGNQVAEDDLFTFPIKTIEAGRAVYTPEGKAVKLQAECMAKLEAGSSIQSCTFVCAKGANVDAAGKGQMPEGLSCIALGGSSSNNAGDSQAAYPACPANVQGNSGWGWTQDAGLCSSSSATSQQFQEKGGCSCQIKTQGYPNCGAGVSVQNGWGWLQSASACSAFANTAQQFREAGGCSCRG